MNKKKLAKAVLWTLNAIALALAIGIPLAWVLMAVAPFFTGRYEDLIPPIVILLCALVACGFVWVGKWAEVQLDTPTPEEVLEATLDAFSKKT